VFRLSRSPSHLLRRAEQFATELFARSELYDGVTLRQTVLLAAIAEAEGASQSDLVRITGVDRSTLAEMMARMEKKGLIARAAAADDGRAKSVRLTADGRRRLDAVLPAIRNVDRSLLAALSASKRAAFQVILAELAEAADEKMSDDATATVKRARPKPPASSKRPRAKR
jgi:DNA-binding MarR family transcriptional regulator